MVEREMIIHKTMLLCSNKSLFVYVCRHLDIVTYELFRMKEEYVRHVPKGKLGVAREDGDLKFIIATIIKICNLDECHLLRFTVHTVAEF